VPRIYLILLVDVEVIVTASYKIESSAADCSTNDTVIVLSGEVAADDSVKSVRTFGYPQLTAEDDYEHDYELIYGLACDVLEHRLRDDVLVTAMRLSIEQLLARWLGGQS
jgi:hypothetical protein